MRFLLHLKCPWTKSPFFVSKYENAMLLKLTASEAYSNWRFNFEMPYWGFEALERDWAEFYSVFNETNRKLDFPSFHCGQDWQTTDRFSQNLLFCITGQNCKIFFSLPKIRNLLIFPVLSLWTSLILMQRFRKLLKTRKNLNFRHEKTLALHYVTISMNRSWEAKAITQ